ncbi:MAG: ORF6C domain-containing protein [Candidatus Wallbacteria bacterium]
MSIKNLKKRISTYINQLLFDQKLTQQGLSKLLNIGAGRLNAYIKEKEIPRIETLIQLAEIGEITLDELVKTDIPPKKREIIPEDHSIFKNSSVNGPVNIANGGIINNNVHNGDVFNNTTVKRYHKYVPQPGDLTDEQSTKLTELVNDIVDWEKKVRRSPKSYAAVWGALKRHFNVTYYKRIGEANFEKAIAYLKAWRGRLTQVGSKSQNDETREKSRKSHYTAINTIAKKELGWSVSILKGYIYENFQVTSMKDLNDKLLNELYNKMTALKRKNK